MITLIESQCRM